MQDYAIKNQQIENENAEYIKFDWEAFNNLTFEEKVNEYLKFSEILLICRKFWNVYIQHMEEPTGTNKHVERRVVLLEDLIILFAGVIDQMRMNIIFE